MVKVGLGNKYLYQIQYKHFSVYPRDLHYLIGHSFLTSLVWGETHNTSHFLYDNKTLYFFYNIGFLGHQLRMNLKGKKLVLLQTK